MHSEGSNCNLHKTKWDNTLILRWIDAATALKSIWMGEVMRVSTASIFCDDSVYSSFNFNASRKPSTECDLNGVWLNVQTAAAAAVDSLVLLQNSQQFLILLNPKGWQWHSNIVYASHQPRLSYGNYTRWIMHAILKIKCLPTFAFFSSLYSLSLWWHKYFAKRQTDFCLSYYQRPPFQSARLFFLSTKFDRFGNCDTVTAVSERASARPLPLDLNGVADILIASVYATTARPNNEHFHFSSTLIPCMILVWRSDELDGIYSRINYERRQRME